MDAARGGRGRWLQRPHRGEVGQPLSRRRPGAAAAPRFNHSYTVESGSSSTSAISAAVIRIGLGKRSRLDPLEPPNRLVRKRLSARRVAELKATLRELMDLE
jgi:hypothetical protein